MSQSDDLSTESPPDTLLVIDAREGQGQRLDQFLTRHLQERLDGISRTRIQRWIALGAVRVDQQVRLPSLRLKGVESIEVEPQLPAEHTEGTRARAVFFHRSLSEHLVE